MDALSVPETYFWREMDQIRALVDLLIPGYVAAHRGKPVEIWCAACASGEEPLSIAMALAEAGWFERAEFRIYASDASQAALDRARSGFYRERSFRVLPPCLRRNTSPRSQVAGRLRRAYMLESTGGWPISWLPSKLARSFGRRSCFVEMCLFLFRPTRSRKRYNDLQRHASSGLSIHWSFRIVGAHYHGIRFAGNGRSVSLHLGIIQASCRRRRCGTIGAHSDRR